ncbi:thiamine phosphate synthase [Rhodoligotrophos appendicifer]|uniref:thiamine phosphate synthase n=1 Tax=Rhodoligotrophos appendicifer TaxID=987056 RepID=UPI002482B091|nr:thiamine phosphate synthase [Rhodoligotrophos appendicifer]
MRSRLFLVAPVGLAPERLTELFDAALLGGDVACLLIAGETESSVEALAAAVMPLAAAHNVAVLLDDCPDLARRIGVDGVQIGADLSRYQDVRRMLGTDMIIGAFCAGSRHAAMELGEAGADFVAFDDIAGDLPEDEDFSLPVWWSSVFEVPCVALMPSEPEGVRALAAGSVEFVRPSDTMWLSPEAARTMVSDLNALMDEVASDEAP